MPDSSHPHCPPAPSPRPARTLLSSSAVFHRTFPCSLIPGQETVSLANTRIDPTNTGQIPPFIDQIGRDFVHHILILFEVQYEFIIPPVGKIRGMEMLHSYSYGGCAGRRRRRCTAVRVCGAGATRRQAPCLGTPLLRRQLDLRRGRERRGHRRGRDLSGSLAAGL